MADAANTIPTETKPRRLLLASVPRTASNLLLKVLNVQQQPGVLTNERGGYFFFEAFTSVRACFGKPADQWTDAEITQSRDIYQQCLDRLEEYSARARDENKIMLAKEHAFWFTDPATMHAPAAKGRQASFLRLRFPASIGPEETFSRNNDTMFSDEYLRTWQFAFIIRHPALAWPSMYRAVTKLTEAGAMGDDDMKGAFLAAMSFTSSRKLFDWGLEHAHKEAMPLVIDAQDIIHNPGSVLRFCEATGLDPKAVQLEWESQEKVDKGPQWDVPKYQDMVAIMLGTLQASKGIVRDKTPATVDIKAEAVKWRSEFGDDVAGLIEKAVWDAMPDYEYLWARRLTC